MIDRSIYRPSALHRALPPAGDVVPVADSEARVCGAIAQIAAGRPVVVVDDEDRENEGDLIFAATYATAKNMSFMVRHTSGFVCVALPESDCQRLHLAAMCTTSQDRHGTAYRVTVDARDGVTTGISAIDRAHTARLLANPSSSAADFNRPGHIVPLLVRDGGVLTRRGHTEAASDLARLAGLPPVGVLCEIVSPTDPTRMATRDELDEFAEHYGLAIITVAELVDHRRRWETAMTRAAEARLPTRHGEFQAIGYRAESGGVEHVALVFGDIADGHNVLVRIHSECLTGDVFGSLRCDCGDQLHAAQQLIAAEGRGVVVYLRGHEGRGIGLIEKMRCYELQDCGLDTVDANLELGLPVDARDYRAAGFILRDLGIESVKLMTNNPEKSLAIQDFGLRLSGRIPLHTFPNQENIGYLRTKQVRMGHDLDVDQLRSPAAASA